MGIGKGFMKVPLVQPPKGYYTQVEAFVFFVFRDCSGTRTRVLNRGPKGVRNPIDEVSMVPYTGQYKTPPVQSKNTQGMRN
jgi:hypothetical protein